MLELLASLRAAESIPMSEHKTLREIIQDAVFASLERNNWNKQAAATELGISLKSIYNHIARMDLEISEK